jgi:hypothetical protein
MQAKFLAQALVAAGMVSLAAASHAALMSCPSAFTAELTAKVENAAGTASAAAACQYLDPPDQSNVANLVNVNAAGFFGHNDWRSNDQTQLGGAGSVGQSGKWLIANVDFAAFDYMIVFKDGSNTNLVAFAFNELFSSGVWSSPFQNPPFVNLKDGQTKDVSHLSIFRRGGEQQVSEPGGVVLFALGLLALACLRRRQVVQTRRRIRERPEL